MYERHINFLSFPLSKQREKFSTGCELNTRPPDIFMDNNLYSRELCQLSYRWFFYLRKQVLKSN